MSVKEVNKKTENYKNTIYVREKNKISIFNISTIKKYIFFFIIISKINFVHCESDNKKTLILLILLVIIVIIIIVLLIIFFVWCCKKKTDIRRDDNQNNYFEGDNYLERDNPEEIQLRERVMNNYPKGLSDYLKEKLISDMYNKKFELFGMQCPICLENFEENKSIILMGGCLHIFHQKCLSELAEKIDLNKRIISQFICPTCRNNLIVGSEKIKKCIKKFPNFFDDMNKNKKITKIKHVKNLINSIIEGKNKNLNNSENISIKNSIKISVENNNEKESDKQEEENYDISYNNKFNSERKLKEETNNNNNEENAIINNNLNIDNH
jgi:hypothetical protein